MSVDYQVNKTIDFELKAARRQYRRALAEWRARCIKAVIPRKTRAKGGRTLKRALDRKECFISDRQEGTRFIHVFSCKGRTVSTLTVTLENFDPDTQNLKESSNKLKSI